MRQWLGQIRSATANRSVVTRTLSRPPWIQGMNLRVPKSILKVDVPNQQSGLVCEAQVLGQMRNTFICDSLGI